MPQLFVNFRSESRAWAQRTIVTVARNLLAPETREVMQKAEVLEALFDARKELWESEHELVLFDILKTLTAEPFATRRMKEY
jgi:hypothetical protein